MFEMCYCVSWTATERHGNKEDIVDGTAVERYYRWIYPFRMSDFTVTIIDLFCTLTSRCVEERLSPVSMVTRLDSE